MKTLQESAQLEFKESYSPTFLKTVSAFANYNGGQIIFGIDDSGKAIGVPNQQELCLRIENAINDSLEPLPRYSIEPAKIDGKETIILKVFPGAEKPYFAKDKAYRRTHTSTVKVDRAELQRLTLEGMNSTFEEQPSQNQDLSFDELDKELAVKIGIEELDWRIYKTLGLLTKDNLYNNAAALLADFNNFQIADIVRFGSTNDMIMDRVQIEKVSLFVAYSKAVEEFKRYYSFETIKGIKREVELLIPEEAFREAVANALVHRDWSVQSSIKITLNADSIEVYSPGGLPYGVTENEYLSGRLSVLRNPVLGDVFARLDYIEKLGTGIKRIKDAYRGFLVKPEFSIMENSICVKLPVTRISESLNETEEKLLEFLSCVSSASRAEIEGALNLTRTPVNKLINEMMGKGLIKRSGAGKSTRYHL